MWQAYQESEVNIYWLIKFMIFMNIIRTIISEEEEEVSGEEIEVVDIKGDEIVKDGENDIVTQITSTVSRLWNSKDNHVFIIL